MGALARDAAAAAIGLALTALFLAATAGCGGGGDESGAAGQRTPPAQVAGSCAFVVEYDGHRYLGNAAAVAPVEGRPLGTATQPGCQDTPNEPTPPDTEVEVAEIEGVPPEVAIVLRNRSDTILVREDREELPPEVQRLLRG